MYHGGKDEGGKEESEDEEEDKDKRESVESYKIINK